MLTINDEAGAILSSVFRLDLTSEIVWDSLLS